MTWLSPAFPVGAFSYSHGIERAIHDGLVRDRATLADWLVDLMHHGSVWNDAVLFAAAFREPVAGEDVAALGRAMAGSSERYMETMLQGSAFAQAASHWTGGRIYAGDDLPYPVAVAKVAAENGIELETALAAYLHAVMSNLIQGAVRLVPLGQSQGVALMAALEASILEITASGSHSSLDDLGSSAIMSEIMAMQHETQYSRVFRS
ncbi:MAG: urease accessory protein UreF [Phyllobacterium sp.]|uniref:urease accessory protein UreF n=1 Tax=Phyllobacterium sp. TaxID=1871046 RepID=UPI0030F018BD